MNAHDSDGLFSPMQAGALSLSHRVVHAPMTRLRADADDSPSLMMVEYYRQRASAGGLIITESAHPSIDSRGYLGAPGIYMDVHVQAWRKVVDAVHERGGKIVIALTPYVRDAFWGGNERHYIDFPRWEAAAG